jgi:hypothetical protein
MQPADERSHHVYESGQNGNWLGGTARVGGGLSTNTQRPRNELNQELRGSFAGADSRCWPRH